MVGDEEQIPLRQRPEILAIATEPDPRDKIARYAGIARTLGDRLGPVLAVLLASRGSDPELEDFARTIDAERLSGAPGFVAQFADRGLLRTDLDRRHASDLVWTLIPPACTSCCKSAAGTQNSTNGGFPEPSPTRCCQPRPVDQLSALARRADLALSCGSRCTLRSRRCFGVTSTHSSGEMKPSACSRDNSRGGDNLTVSSPAD